MTASRLVDGLLPVGPGGRSVSARLPMTWPPHEQRARPGIRLDGAQETRGSDRQGHGRGPRANTCTPGTGREASLTAERHVRPGRQEHPHSAHGHGHPAVCRTEPARRGHREEGAGPALRRPPQPTRQGRESQQGASRGLPARDRTRALEGAQESRKGFGPAERWGSHFWSQAPPEESVGPRAPPSLASGAALTFLFPAQVSLSPGRGQGLGVFHLGIQRRDCSWTCPETRWSPGGVAAGDAEVVKTPRQRRPAGRRTCAEPGCLHKQRRPASGGAGEGKGTPACPKMPVATFFPKALPSAPS